MTVVVGVDGLPESYAAIRLARQEAEYRRSRLIAVIAHGGGTSLGVPGGRPLATSLGVDEHHALAETTLRRAVNDALGTESVPDGVDLHVIVGVPGHVLVQAARNFSAQLMVLATRSTKTPSRLFGAVGQYVLRNAPCPVLVVPEAGGDL